MIMLSKINPNGARVSRLARDARIEKERSKSIRRSSLICGEYGFLRSNPDRSYDLGQNPDPDGLLPTMFGARK
jgi:hypothetical protein